MRMGRGEVIPEIFVIGLLVTIYTIISVMVIKKVWIRVVSHKAVVRAFVQSMIIGHVTKNRGQCKWLSVA